MNPAHCADIRTCLVVQVAGAMPNRADVLLLMGAICYQLKDYHQCISYNDRCILIDPNLAEAHANLANALQQLGNIDMAIVYYQVRAGLTDGLDGLGYLGSRAYSLATAVAVLQSRGW